MSDPIFENALKCVAKELNNLGYSPNMKRAPKVRFEL